MAINRDNKRLAKNTFLLYGRMMLTMLIALYTSRVVLSALGIESFGVYSVVGSLLGMFGFLNGTLSGATSRYLTFEIGRNDQERLQKVFNVALISHLGLALIVIVLCETVGLWFFYNKIVIPTEDREAAFWVFQLSVIGILLGFTQIPYNAMLIAYENMKVYAYVSVVEVSVKLLVVYLLVVSPFNKLITYSVLLLIVQIGFIIFYRVYCIRKYPSSRLSFCKDGSLYREIFGYAGADMIGNFSCLLQGEGMNLLLNMFFGPVANAARGVAYQVQGAISQFSNNFMTAARPQIIKLYAKNEIQKMFLLAKRSSWMSYYLLWIIILPLALNLKYVLSLWLEATPEYTTSFLMIIFAISLVQSLKTPRTIIYHAMGRLKVVNLLVGTVLCLSFPAAYIALKMGASPNSVFFCILGSIIASEFVSCFVLKKYLDYSISNYLKEVHGRCLLTSVISAIIPVYFYGCCDTLHPFVRLILTTIVSVVSVGAIVYFVGIDSYSRDKILEFIKAKLKRNATVSAV